MQLREGPLPKQEDGKKADKEVVSSSKLPEMADPFALEFKTPREDKYQGEASQMVQDGPNEKISRSVSDTKADLSSGPSPSGKRGLQ